MVTSLQVKQSQHETRVPVTVFELVGELDGSNYEQFQKELLQAIEVGARYVVLDLSQLSYVSSAGLRALFKLAKALSAKGGIPTGSSNSNTSSFKSPYLKLFNPLPDVRRSLDVMGFNMSMEIYSDLNEVLGSF